MITYVVAALLYAFDHIGIVIADEAVKQYGRRPLHPLQRTGKAPDSDPQPISAPSIVALGLRVVSAQIGVIAAARHEGEFLNIQSDVKSQTLTVGPTVVASFL